MRLICAPGGVVSPEFPAQGTGDVAHAGFSDVMADVSLFCSPEEIESTGRKAPRGMKRRLSGKPEETREMLSPFFAACKKYGLKTTAFYAPYLMRRTKRGDLNGLVEKLAVESLRAANENGAEYIIVRPLFSGTSDAWEESREFYLRLANMPEARGITILLENQCRDINGHLVRGLMADGCDAAAWADRLNDAAGAEKFGVALNVSAANACGQNFYEFITSVEKRLKAVTISDSDGRFEEALIPFTSAHRGGSSTDWLNIIRGLREIKFDGLMILNAKETLGAFSPLIRPEAMRLLKKSGEYVMWQVGMENALAKYGSRVLFGAGNMCRAYMKCYGEKYPPLFTCDNNKARWGEEFCSIIIEPPEKLKSLPEDCAIFICNIYYREIEEQIRGMGIKNPVEFFNDEYLGSFHLNRVEDIGAADEKGEVIR